MAQTTLTPVSRRTRSNILGFNQSTQLDTRDEINAALTSATRPLRIRKKNLALDDDDDGDLDSSRDVRRDHDLMQRLQMRSLVSNSIFKQTADENVSPSSRKSPHAPGLAVRKLRERQESSESLQSSVVNSPQTTKEKRVLSNSQNENIQILDTIGHEDTNAEKAGASSPSVDKAANRQSHDWTNLQSHSFVSNSIFKQPQTYESRETTPMVLSPRRLSSNVNKGLSSRDRTPPISRTPRTLKTPDFAPSSAHNSFSNVRSHVSPYVPCAPVSPSPEPSHKFAHPKVDEIPRMLQFDKEVGSEKSENEPTHSLAQGQLDTADESFQDSYSVLFDIDKMEDDVRNMTIGASAVSTDSAAESKDLGLDTANLEKQMTAAVTPVLCEEEHREEIEVRSFKPARPRSEVLQSSKFLEPIESNADVISNESRDEVLDRLLYTFSSGSPRQNSDDADSKEKAKMTYRPSQSGSFIPEIDNEFELQGHELTESLPIFGLSNDFAQNGVGSSITVRETKVSTCPPPREPVKSSNEEAEVRGRTFQEVSGSSLSTVLPQKNADSTTTSLERKTPTPPSSEDLLDVASDEDAEGRLRNFHNSSRALEAPSFPNDLPLKHVDSTIAGRDSELPKDLLDASSGEDSEVRGRIFYKSNGAVGKRFSSGLQNQQATISTTTREAEKVTPSVSKELSDLASDEDSEVRGKTFHRSSGMLGTNISSGFPETNSFSSIGVPEVKRETLPFAKESLKSALSDDAVVQRRNFQQSLESPAMSSLSSGLQRHNADISKSGRDRMSTTNRSHTRELLRAPSVEEDEGRGRSLGKSSASSARSITPTRAEQEGAILAARRRRRRSHSLNDSDRLKKADEEESIFESIREEISENGTPSRMSYAEKTGVLLDTPIYQPFGRLINQEIDRIVEGRGKNYVARNASKTIIASSDDKVLNSSFAGDIDGGPVWRTARRPSDIHSWARKTSNINSKTVGPDSQKPDSYRGKLFVKVLKLENLELPVPIEPVLFTCTLDNGIHEVTTETIPLARTAGINQEFVLLVTPGLEFTLTLKLKLDHRMASPELQRPKQKTGIARILQSPRKVSGPKFSEQYMSLVRAASPDGSFARSYISFNKIEQHCGSRVFSVSFPCLNEWTNDSSPVQFKKGNRVNSCSYPLRQPYTVGSIMLQMFYLTREGMTSSDIPRCLNDIELGLKLGEWHTRKWYEGVMSQMGAGTTYWKRRHYELIGGNLIARNEITKSLVGVMDLSKAIAFSDDKAVGQQGIFGSEQRKHAPPPTPMLPPLSGAKGKRALDSKLGAQSVLAKRLKGQDEDGYYAVERSFRIIFRDGTVISFYTDTEEDKQDWLKVIAALIGKIPKNPTWAARIIRQRDIDNRNTNRNASGATSLTGSSVSPSAKVCEEDSIGSRQFTRSTRSRLMTISKRQGG